MNDEVIITSYVVTVDVMKAFGHESHVLAQVSDAEVIFIAIIAALYFQNHHKRPIFRYPYFGVYTAVFRAVFRVLRKNFTFFMLILIQFSVSQMETAGILAKIAINKPKNAVLRKPYFIGGGK